MNNPNLSINFNVFEKDVERQELQKLQAYINNLNTLVSKVPASICLGISTSSARPLNTNLPTIIYETVEFDTEGIYSPANGKIKIKTPGKYRFSGSYISDGAGILVSTNNLSALILAVNGVTEKTLAFQRVNAGGVLILGAQGSVTLDLKTGQIVTITGYSDNVTTLDASSPGANFVYMEHVGT